METTPPGPAIASLEKDCLDVFRAASAFNLAECEERVPKLKAQVDAIAQLVRSRASAYAVGVSVWCVYVPA